MATDEPVVYLDTFHTQAMAEILEAFVTFNSALSRVVGGSLEPEAVDVVVRTYGDEYARCFFLDGEAYIEPLYNPIRSVNDR